MKAFISIVICTIFLSGCGGYVVHFGDARVSHGFKYHHSAYRLVIDKIPIGQTGTFSYEVIGLPEPIMPMDLTIRAGDVQKEPPLWESVKIKVSIVDKSDQRSLISRTIEPQTEAIVIERSNDCGGNYSYIPPYFKLWDRDQVANIRVKSYSVQVDVIEPSKDQLDTIELSGFFFSEKNYRELVK